LARLKRDKRANKPALKGLTSATKNEKELPQVGLGGGSWSEKARGMTALSWHEPCSRKRPEVNPTWVLIGTAQGKQLT